MVAPAASGELSIALLIGSRIQFHEAEQVRVTRVAAESFKMEPPCNSRQLPAALLKILFEPGEGLIFISETGIHSSQEQSAGLTLGVV
jgi:hypothetical protein